VAEPLSVYRKLVVYMQMDKTVLSFIHVIFLVCTYIVRFVGVIHNLTIVPDDGPRRESKHVGLAYRHCNI
jgi:hypothetical protein